MQIDSRQENKQPEERKSNVPVFRVNLADDTQMKGEAIDKFISILNEMKQDRYD
jgi:hypothetical protein